MHWLNIETSKFENSIVAFPDHTHLLFCVLGQVWYLVVSIPDLGPLPYFVESVNGNYF